MVLDFVQAENDFPLISESELIIRRRASLFPIEAAHHQFNEKPIEVVPPVQRAGGFDLGLGPFQIHPDTLIAADNGTLCSFRVIKTLSQSYSKGSRYALQ
jgi:hypothetical protein